MIENEILGKVCSRILDEEEPVINTGFSDLDTMLQGIDKSSIITIGARPSMGKTSFMTTIMLNLLEQKKKCLYFSMEMSTEQQLQGYIAYINHVDSYFYVKLKNYAHKLEQKYFVKIPFFTKNKPKIKKPTL